VHGGGGNFVSTHRRRQTNSDNAISHSASAAAAAAVAAVAAVAVIVAVHREAEKRTNFILCASFYCSTETGDFFSHKLRNV